MGLDFNFQVDIHIVCPDEPLVAVAIVVTILLVIICSCTLEIVPLIIGDIFEVFIKYIGTAAVLDAAGVVL